MGSQLEPSAKSAVETRCQGSPRTKRPPLRLRALLLPCALFGAALAGLWGGCSASSSGGDGSGNDGTAAAAATGAGGAGGSGGWLFTGGTGGGVNHLVIEPQDPVLTYTGSPLTQQFEALNDGQVVTPSWSLDDAAFGSIDTAGLFTASGAYGGVTNILAQYGDAQATTTVTVKMELSENPGGIPQGTIDLLHQGGSADAQFRWLYPYDATVFPRGLPSPTLQFGGAAPTAVWVHAESQSQSIVYDGYFAPTVARVTLSEATWKAITYSVGAGETLTIQVTKANGDQVTGPITENWKVAQAPLKGTLYYNSYDSQLASGTGAVLKLKPGTSAQLVQGGGGKCTVCHSVAMSGNLMLASNNSYGTGAQYDLGNNAAQSGNRNDYAYNFPAVYPDGTIALSTSGQHIGGMWGSAVSQLYDTATGNAIAAPGFDGVVSYAAMPVFAPSGTKIAFNDEDIGDRHTLVVMDFDRPTNTFSNLVQIANDPVNVLGWPSWLPDDSAVLCDVNDGAGGLAYMGIQDYGTWFGNRAELALIDVATQQRTMLDQLNGKVNGVNYLPFGDDDARRSFEPTVLPIAVGGYYWVVFTSRRQYGNTINSPETNQYGSGLRKKLWIAAIDINAVPGQDPSHPAIFLDGQEIASGNMRGFWVLDPCKADGETCESGDECCNGFCRQINQDGEIVQVCVPPPEGCSQEFESCQTTADCCDAPDGYTCINFHCAAPPPPR